MSIQGDPRVTILNLQPLLNRLGVKGIAVHRWDPVIHPVALVDGSVQAVTGQLLDVPFTAGETTAPAANTRLANTGALVAGQYNITWMLEAGVDTAAFRLRRRNAGDTADIWAVRVTNPGFGFVGPQSMRVNLAVNEFIVIENVAAGSVGIVYQAIIWVQGPF